MKINNSNMFTLSIKYCRAFSLSLFISSLGLSIAHAELVDLSNKSDSHESTDVVRQYNVLKAKGLDAETKLELVEQLNASIEKNDSENYEQDATSWQLLAKIYYDNGYDDYALYSANEAIKAGARSKELEYILLNTSMSVANEQIDAGYLEDMTDETFLDQYQTILSKIYGQVYNFNYDESLPKKTVRASTAKKKATSKKKSVKRKTRKSVTAKKRSRKTTISSRAKAKSRAQVKRKAVSRKKATTKKPVRSAPAKKSTVDRPSPTKKKAASDPFAILR